MIENLGLTIDGVLNKLTEISLCFATRHNWIDNGSSPNFRRCLRCRRFEVCPARVERRLTGSVSTR